MNTSSNSRKRRKPGFASYLLVLSTGAILILLTVSAYRRAVNSREVQAKVQLRSDYAEKEDAILRAIVAVTPNRAIQAMRHNSNSSTTISHPLRWENIFKDSFSLANAQTSIASNVMEKVAIAGPASGGSAEVISLMDEETRSTLVIRSGNSGDSTSTLDSAKIAKIFKALNNETSLLSAGINRSLGTGFPPPLTTTNTTTTARDSIYPIISADKEYGTLAQSKVALPVSSYKKFNQISYPQINFGYAKPGDLFVAKRNWWAFRLDAREQDFVAPDPTRAGRDFVLSIYEIPSQLAISASSFMSFGKYASGDEWDPDRVSIKGGVFGGKLEVEGESKFDTLASRRSMALGDDVSIGGKTFATDPFAAGYREQFRKDGGDFMPVSLSSESGRVAFIPINRGQEFFDRYAPENITAETNTISPTTWNNYSVGAMQCAMRLDITRVVSATNPTPTEFKFSYFKGGTRKTDTISLTTATSGATKNLPPGYLFACNENATYNFGTTVVDVAYGLNGAWAYQTGVTGSVTFNNARFGDPLVGTVKSGYFRPSYSHEIKPLTSGKICIAIYPQRFANLLASLNADSTAVNHSLVVNVDYTNIGATYPKKPSVNPCTDLDYGLILQECSDLTTFTKGFSLVTNLRTYIGDDFNVVEATPPAGYTVPVGEKYYPPCSLFAPEKRYGVEVDPFAVRLDGQIGSMAKVDKVYVSDPDPAKIRPLDSKNMSGSAIDADRITVNLRPIRHPAELPPITMMNWLVVLEERRKEFIGN